MAYADLLDNEGIKSQYLCVIEPRRFVNSGWTNVSGTRYTIDFTYGEVTVVRVDNTVATQASSSTLSDGDWYFDDNVIYFDDSSTDPNSGTLITISYEIFLGTFDAHFNRDPLDSTSKVVYYSPLIVSSPAIKQSVSDGFFGIFPILSSSINLSAVTQELLVHLYDSSFNLAPIKIYHWLDTLITANVKLITQGLCGDINYNRDAISIVVFDSNKIYETDYRHSTDSFYDFSTFANLDPNFEARPIRKVYGVVDGFIPVNVDFVEVAPTTSDNRDWLCAKPASNLGSVSTTVLSSPSSTTTRTYLTSADGFRVGDSVWIDSNAGSGFDEFVLVTAVNKTGSHYIDHATITNVAANPDVVKRSYVGNVGIVKDGVFYQALYGRDYDEYNVSDVYGFSFTTTMESNLSLPSNLATVDLVFCRVYGNKNTATLGGPSFGSDSTETGNLTNPVVILYELIKNAGITESEINTSSFSSLEATVTREIGFAIPHNSTQEFGTYKDIFSEILASEIMRLSFDDNNLYKLSQAGPIGTIDKTVDESLIIVDSFNYYFNFQDVISTVIVQYQSREVSRKNTIGETSYLAVSSTSEVAKQLHQIDRQKTFTSLHFKSDDAQVLADRIKFYVGDRIGTIRFDTKNEFFNSEINDFFTVSTDRMPGYEYVSKTLRNQNGVMIDSEKSLNKITITLDDQKGIEDNSGSW